MKFRLALFVFCFALVLQAQMEMNVDQLAQFLRSELAMKQSTDKQIAAYLKKVHLNEKLTDKTIEDLEAQGAGPKTVDALHALRDESAKLKPPSHDATYSPETAPDNSLKGGPATVTLGAKPATIPPPNSVRQQEILDAIKQYALTYTENLPNFICLQVTRHYIDPNAGDNYRIIGTVNAQLGYNQGQEHYRVISVNGKLQDANVSMNDVGAKIGGASSTGEFGSLMRGIFSPSSEAQFDWSKWGTLRGKRVAVFHYFIDSGHSDKYIVYNNDQQIITAYEGLIYADENTGAVARIVFQAVNIPKSFPVSEAYERLDYDDVEINGQPYICPLKALLTMTAGRDKTKNDIEFRMYRKFGTNSEIKYGDIVNSEPIPDSKTQEQPASASAPTQPKKTGGSDPFSLPTPPPPPPK
ncbi:MAG: hypothetical protein M3Y57_19670 [Acidobacteriota bacterium]|nr:hypothetical protein [Acidobacteriota bacterium]